MSRPMKKLHNTQETVQYITRLGITRVDTIKRLIVARIEGNEQYPMEIRYSRKERQFTMYADSPLRVPNRFYT
jgi:hypothetical protein